MQATTRKVAEVTLTAQLQHQNHHGLFQALLEGGLSLLSAFVLMQPLLVLPMPITNEIDVRIFFKKGILHSAEVLT
jgi:hypothetical protein